MGRVGHASNTNVKAPAVLLPVTTALFWQTLPQVLPGKTRSVMDDEASEMNTPSPMMFGSCPLGCCGKYGCRAPGGLSGFSFVSCSSFLGTKMRKAASLGPTVNSITALGY